MKRGNGKESPAPPETGKETTMFNVLRWNRIKLDAAPGTLVYAGKKRDFAPSVLHLAYTADTLSETRPDPGQGVNLAQGCVNFLVVTGVHDADVIKTVGASLDLPPLFQEDVLNTGHRAGLAWADEETGFIIMRHLDAEGERVVNEQVSLVWRDGLVAVFLERDSGLLDGVLARIRQGRGRIRRSGAAYLMSAVLDGLVDSHTRTLTTLGDRAQDLENRLEEKLSDDLLGELYALKRETILFRNSLLPVREIFKGLLREDAEIAPDVVPFLQDAAGHHDQAIEGVAALHDILTSMIDYQISLIGIRTNKVMQLLTVIATIFIPLTFIAGVYGMNFDHMPELQWRYGYHAVIGLMAAVGVGMAVYFKRKKYL
jgi:magnesium transporter